MPISVYERIPDLLETPIDTVVPKCSCSIDKESGWFTPCCEEHEQEYIEYLNSI